MGNRESLLRKAIAAPSSLSFSDLCSLAEAYGFELARTSGSHRIYKRRGVMKVMNFQSDGGKAKPYQVKQLLSELRDLGLVED